MQPNSCFEITFKSNDNHSFVYTTNAQSEEEATVKGFKRIAEKGWEHHEYSKFSGKTKEKSNEKNN